MNIIGLHDKNLYYIGGVVRDRILGLKSLDVDLTYLGDAIEFAQNISNAKVIKVNEPFGTVKIKYCGKRIDIASTRREVYPQKGHLPEVTEIGCSLEEDVQRRDFTINALAQSTETGEIIDYVNGLEDIKNKTLRVLHDDSFIDDPTRIIRGLKFRVRFGFELDEHTRALQNDYLNNINYDMSYKRVKKELKETLNNDKAFELFLSDGIYKLVAPIEVKPFKVEISKYLEKYRPESVWIIYAGLLPDVSSLPLTNLETRIVNEYHEIKHSVPVDDLEIYKLFNDRRLETVIMYGATVNEKIAKRYLELLSKIKVCITGEDLIQLGIMPSAKYKNCFDEILNQKIKNPNMSKEQELEFAKKYFVKFFQKGT